MFSAEIAQKISAHFPEVTAIPVPEKFVRDPEPALKVPSAKLKEVCRYLKDSADMAFDFPIQMTAVDFIKEGVFELVYYLYSTKHKKLYLGFQKSGS